MLSAGDGIAYSYDGNGQRVSAVKQTGTRSYVYDLESLHLLTESGLNGSGAAYEYVWFGGPVAESTSAGAQYWIYTDHLLAPVILTDATGAVKWQADYEPFGAVYNLRTSDLHQPLRRFGQEAVERAADRYSS
jgi:uncharacterized protein RhaS with RHS repeats